MSGGPDSLSSGLKFGTGLIIAVVVFASLGLIALCGFCWLASYGLERGQATIAVEPLPTRAIVTFATDDNQDATPQSGSQNAEFLAIVRNPDSQGWTDVQYNAYKDSLKGTYIENWTGTIVEAKESLLGEYYIEVNMPGTEDSVDVYIYTTKEAALAMRKGQQITFSGTIRGLWPEIFEDNDTVQIKDATIN